MKQTQLDLIREQLKTNGYVSRNWCLRRYITRCASRIKDLQKEGMNIKGVKDGNDFVYWIVREVKEEVKPLSTVSSQGQLFRISIYY